jgi:molybdenum cofactor cytidylyltransferase
MGAQKQALELGGKPMVQHVLDAFTHSTLDEVVLVLSPTLHWRPEPRRGFRVVLNPSAEEGISTSVKVGIHAVDPRTEAVLIGLADKPFLLGSTIDAMIGAYRRSSAEIIVPVHDGKRGNPVLFRKSLFRQLSRLKGDVGAKLVVESGKYSVAEVPVDDFGVLFDVDTPADFRKAKRMMLSAGSVMTERKARK